MTEVSFRARDWMIQVVEDTSETSCGESRSSERVLDRWTIVEARRYAKELNDAIETVMKNTQVYVNIPEEQYTKVVTLAQAVRLRNELNIELKKAGV